MQQETQGGEKRTINSSVDSAENVSIFNLSTYFTIHLGQE